MCFMTVIDKHCVKMVNYSIKVYARLKKEVNKYDLGSYDILKKNNGFDDIVFSKETSNTSLGSYGFRFHKIFDQKSTQSEVFETVAVPVINSVLEGYNGTIFAYGQTGSGKTFTITGSPKCYNDRGIIPRCIQYVFRRNEKISEKPTIYMSYMEIYNEIGYDLLSPKQLKSAKYLEELPRITLLEDKKGEAHIRNLSVLPVTTEQEAMRMLFLGDTNRTIAETPMNEYSSRSHCIFTIYLTHRNAGSNNLRFSKLHLVDLAGSERVSKSQSTGVALSEAKHINLSLHFLQQVILALSESRRTHIPYRNSMMTFILKDSLSGNCMTSMLATLAVSKNNILETISTCRFAQRVSLISTEPVINEIIDPQHEISFLKNKIEELECQLASATGFKNSLTLTDSQKSQCQHQVIQYLKEDSTNQEINLIEPNLKQVQFCFSLLKNEVTSHKQKFEELKSKLNDTNTEINHLKKDILKRDENITHTVQLKNSMHLPSQVIRNGQEYISISNEGSGDLFKKFLSYPENSSALSFYQTTLEKKLEMAKIYAQAIKQCQKNISYIKHQLETNSCFSEKSYLIQELHEQQEIYKKALIELKEIENKTRHLESGLKQEEYKVTHFFKEWLIQNNLKTSKRHHLQSCISESKHLHSSNSRMPVYPTQYFEHSLCPRKKFDPIFPGYENENADEICSCRNQYSEARSCNFSYHNPHHPEINICSAPQGCQELNHEAVAVSCQNKKYMGTNSHDLCECSYYEYPSTTNREDAIPNYCEELSIDASSVTEREVYHESQPEIGNDSRSIFNTLSEKDIRNNATKKTETNIDTEEDEIDNSHKIFFKETDSKEFREFMGTVTLTGEPEIDEDIFCFYRTKV